MKNPVFKAQVAALFEKTALGHDPRVVATQVDPTVAARISRGLATTEALKDFGSGFGSLGRGGYRALSALTAPSTGVLTRGVSRATRAITTNPALARNAVALAALAPILGRAFDTSQKHLEADLVTPYTNPDRVIQANLDDFLEKKAELYVGTKTADPVKPLPLPPEVKKLMSDERRRTTKSVSSAVMRRMQANAPSFWQSAGLHITEGIGKGVGSSLGGAVVNLVAHGIGTGVSALHDRFFLEPRRKALVDVLLRSDPVLSDAVERNPDARVAVLDAYATMVRFAPQLSLDQNAVRSFLREAILGGAGVNYATIKNLVDTERSISDAKPQYGGH